VQQLGTSRVGSVDTVLKNIDNQLTQLASRRAPLAAAAAAAPHDPVAQNRLAGIDRLISGPVRGPEQGLAGRRRDRAAAGGAAGAAAAGGGLRRAGAAARPCRPARARGRRRDRGLGRERSGRRCPVPSRVAEAARRAAARNAHRRPGGGRRTSAGGCGWRRPGPECARSCSSAPAGRPLPPRVVAAIAAAALTDGDGAPLGPPDPAGAGSAPAGEDGRPRGGGRAAAGQRGRGTPTDRPPLAARSAGTLTTPAPVAADGAPAALPSGRSTRRPGRPGRAAPGVRVRRPRTGRGVEPGRPARSGWSSSRPRSTGSRRCGRCGT
jgi:hypothetical protein